MLRSVSKSLLAKLVVVAVVYTAVVRLSIDAIPSTQLWPASGIALAALLRWGPRMLLALVPAHLLADLAAGLLPSFAVAAAAVAAVQSAGAAWLLYRLRFDRSFTSPRDALAFVLVAVVAAPGVGATLGATGLCASGQVPWRDFAPVLRLWWTGHAVGALVVAPILLLADRAPSHVARTRRWPEAALATAALLVVCFAVFSPWTDLGAENQPISFAVFPIVAWAAYRLGPAGAAAANLLVAGIAVWGTLGGSGPFVRGSIEESVFFTWAFLSVTSVASLVLAALVAARDRSERELREASDALRALETATRAGSWIWRPDTRIHLGSPRQRELHGLADHGNPIPEELLLERIHADDRRRVLQEFQAAWRSRGRIETEYRVALPDGSVRWLATSGACLPVDPARPSGPFQMVGVHVDVSPRKQLEASVRRGDRLASLGTFAAGVAHELNNPLGTILLAAEEARACVHDSEVTARALDDIADDAKRAARIVRSVLRFAKEEPTERSRVDLRDCVERALARTRPYCRERGVALELRSAPIPLEIVANATEIEQLVQNLVSNAAEACDRDRRIRVEVDLDGAEVTLTIADEGRGMTSTEIEHAFDPFYTTRSREGGSGLGLSICHGIVQTHDGGIEIESAPGYGTRVRVRLPRAAAEPSEAMGASDGPTARGR